MDDLLGVTAFGEAAQPSVIVGRDNDQIDFADPRRGQNLRSRLTAAKERLGVRVLGSDDIEQRKQI